jgi:uncharacterized membrane protein (UPF0127 family)
MRIIPSALLILALSAMPAYAGLPLKIADVCVKGLCVKAEIADTDQARSQGLMYRDSLSDAEGMLFIFRSSERHAFWMKNMRISIDIIWIDKDKRVVDIKSRVPPCGGACESIMPSNDALYVLELRSGFTDDHNIKIGDVVSIGQSHS